MRTTTTPELQATTPAGDDMVRGAEWFASTFVDGARAHDRDGTFATEHLDALRTAGFLVMPVPAAMGGGDVLSNHDVLVACSRLARGDAATTIGVNMHFAVILNLVRAWQVSGAREQADRARMAADTLQAIVDAGIVLASAVSEPGGDQDLTRPRTTATRDDEGWVITGTKGFATMAPAATLLTVGVTFVAEDGSERYGFAAVPTSAPGVELHDDWDALGMRASASGSVTFHDVRVGPGGVTDGFPAGSFSTPLLDRFLASGGLHAAATLGIAESAHAEAVAMLRPRAAAAVEDPFITMRLAENVIDLASMRAVLDRAGHRIDEYHATFPAGDAPFEDAQAAYADVQAAKTHLNEAGSRVVDRALALSGGRGYLAASPLAKAWRDARAGAFMHPLGANRAYDFLARTELGITPRSR
jgi:alkylation response protein AidB-like acyl-CoA dehydrogenase